MSSPSENNKRIAKNTLFLYARTLLIMLIAFYTSRIVLKSLGVEDYGIYNVVGGAVAMLGFINSSMTSATQRYITFVLAEGNRSQLQKVFSMSLQVHFLIAVAVLVLSETVGLWFMFTQMRIPPERMDAAFWVLQCSVVSTVVMIVSVPYNAVIIAHEKMSAFAYISMLEAVLKLAVVYLLVVFSYDKLILYAVLIVAVQLLMRFCYSYYCRTHFEEAQYRYVRDKDLFRQMTKFAGWSLFGNLSCVLYGQGLDMLLNVFFGPVVNAARAVAVQVQNAMQQFVGNFQMALNPQITKTYAKGEMDEMHALIFRSARFSFYMLFFLSLPVLFEADFVLAVWLETVPEDASLFLRIMIGTSLLYTLSNPLMVANQATGVVGRYQAFCGSILLLIVPISWVCLWLGCPAYAVFVVHFVVESVVQLVRMLILRPLIGIGLADYFKNIYKKVAGVVMLSLLMPAVIYRGMDDTAFRFLVMCVSCALSVGMVTYWVGLSKHERLFFRSKMLDIYARMRSH